MCFVSLEDEFGLVNLVLCPKVFAKARRILREAPLSSVEGKSQREHGTLHLIVWNVAVLRLE